MLGRCLQKGPMGQGTIMCTYLAMALEKANRLEQGGRRLGVTEEAPVTTYLPDIGEELMTEQQLFSQS